MRGAKFGCTVPKAPGQGSGFDPEIGLARAGLVASLDMRGNNQECVKS